MRSKVLITIIIILITASLFAETTEDNVFKRNGMYLETYLIRHDFSEGFVSINYERIMGKRARMNFRIGVYPDLESTVSIPFTLSWITGPKRAHHFEYGIGGVFRIEHFVDPYGMNDREWFFDFPAIMIPIMYRYQKDTPWSVRAGINLFVSWPILPSPSISVGYRF